MTVMETVFLETLLERMALLQINSYLGRNMMDFLNVWLPQIIGYAELIGDQDKTSRCWINGLCERTSVMNSDELIEQVFDDLDSDAVISNDLEPSSLPSGKRVAVEKLISSLRQIDEAQTPEFAYQKVEALFNLSCGKR